MGENGTREIEENNSKWVIWVSAIYVLLNAYLTYKEIYWLYLLPVILGVVYLAVYQLDKVILVLFFLTPLSVNVEDIGLGVGVNFPTEPLFFGLLILLSLKLVKDFNKGNSILKHPVTVAILINFGWLSLTTLTSEYPLVSVKFMVSRLWFLASCYFACTILFQNISNIYRSVWLYVIGFSGVILFSIYFLALNHTI